MEDEYKPNSHKYHQEQDTEVVTEEKPEAIVPVAKGKIRKKSKGEKFLCSFFDIDDAKHIGEWLIYGVIVPTMKDAAVNIIFGTVERAFPAAKEYRKSANYREPNTVSYSKFYDESRATREVSDSRDSSQNVKKGATRQVEDIALPTLDDAIKARDEMRHILERYGFLRVSDYYEVCGVLADYTMDNYGWYSLDGMTIEEVSINPDDDPKHEYPDPHAVIMPRPRLKKDK